MTADRREISPGRALCAGRLLKTLSHPMLDRTLIALREVGGEGLDRRELRRQLGLLAAQGLRGSLQALVRLRAAEAFPDVWGLSTDPGHTF